ncbi:unnamed protein product [Heligmosomoides polygyrus]|uniref:CRIM domain-containing protein n=1 Tax=Heligmosomoides polygyrus TaxID=6339 RepID=A0A183GKL6_HELPZ|nr:unnamed protein product [Heligmosomoides polygyrus]
MPLAGDAIPLAHVVDLRTKDRRGGRAVTIERKVAEGDLVVVAHVKHASRAEIRAMAFSDELELIDQIRHELRIEDDSGTCARVVAPERRFIAGHGALVDNPLLAYARFEAVGGQPSKTILVLFATSEEANDNIPRLQPSAKVRDVIGYSLYRFYRDFEKVLSGDVDDYQLLMADDSGEIESDLPPLDRGRPIGDLGFTVLALVAKERSANGEEKSTYRIVVYLPNGHQFVFELENLDNTLEWLRDEALKRKRIHESIQRRDFLAGNRPFWSSCFQKSYKSSFHIAESCQQNYDVELCNSAVAPIRVKRGVRFLPKIDDLSFQSESGTPPPPHV